MAMNWFAPSLRSRSTVRMEDKVCTFPRDRKREISSFCVVSRRSEKMRDSRRKCSTVCTLRQMEGKLFVDLQEVNG